MRRFKKLISSILLVSFLSISVSSCIGPFKLTNVTYQWNQTIGSKWANEGVFILFIPVYALTFFIDGFILNPIEFWKNRPGYSMKEGEEKRISSADGKSGYIITRTKEGYQYELVRGEKRKQVNFVYDDSSMLWSLHSEGQITPMVQLVQDGHTSPVAKIFLQDGTTVLVDATLTDRASILQEMNRIMGSQPDLLAP